MVEEKRVLIIMGVSGTGKSTIGNMLSEHLEIPFFDGDDFHPKENVAKMSTGKPLNDDDRKGWLLTLNQLAKKQKHTGAIIACSALKEKYRELLRNGLEDIMVFIHLEGSFELIKSRLEQRKGHFMPLQLLQSQFDALETPSDAITVSVSEPPEKILQNVLTQLGA
ncbi:gluconokinase [Flagellimonas sp. HMM57]|uniref:gluconokinase n=1 Tax=unclassified Flagellimonas TaxID=2644544 RepID=UPI0013D278D6|nr:MULTISPECIES: gluconokinase [unclassified Flagellimonas]UII75606.1 gluconokinase [Flagellimonas sp. HMM57]